MKIQSQRTMNDSQVLRPWLIASMIIGLGANLIGPSAFAADATLTVNVSGMRSTKGNIVVCLWTKSIKGFPMCSKSITHHVTSADTSNATVTFSNVPPGEYALSAFHDENGNGKIEQSMIGKPKEGIAMSNIDMSQKPKGKKPPRPSFDKSKFSVNGSSSQSLSLIYF
jgi:uncharacterized protein (DUF2141 family)